MDIRVMTLTAAALLVSQSGWAQVTNGDFEQWNDNAPAGWSVIDTGIALSPVSAPVIQGGLAAQVTVNTGTQGNTDLQQTVHVEQGQTYPFTVSLYHTEGHVKARLVVDGYQGYSNPQQINQWQTISYTYTATMTKEIQVGLRFYDESGFDGSEVVYVDHFLPTDTSEPPTPACNDTIATLTLVTDQYASETSWRLANAGGAVLFEGAGYANETTNTREMCLADGDYTFTINDSYGDGLCCRAGNGSFALTVDGQTLASGGQFQHSQAFPFTLGDTEAPPPSDLDEYYQSAAGKTGFALKTALYNIINQHNSRGYSAIWDLVKVADLDHYYENDGSVLDMYSEQPATSDAVHFTKVTDQCGQYSGEGDCYNREHSFPKSWFGGKVEPMNSDGHHIFATDGYVNAKRSNWPFGEVGSATYTSGNGSKLGVAESGLGYTGTVFEPLDAFKGDFARAYFYMATRYENEIASWEGNTTNADAILDGTNTTVFEPWMLNMLKRWHQNDPVSQKEIDRNQAVFEFQGNRNPFIDHPEFVGAIWGN
ncbi:endonuclease [Photobacterium sp. TY1-4]|uniref:endonuclease n=1 Tax=Photobacterium sp. TY1-4 TaxID=2899122 RepID=UPI0021BF2DB1|nr:endonuclease [Photobacterium sp. TY1-4]UXI00275.1 endonuclease [Photobacterium sp. TY1-4]